MNDIWAANTEYADWVGNEPDERQNVKPRP